MVLLLLYAPTSPTVQKSEHDIVLGPRVLGRGEMRTFISRHPHIPRWSHTLLARDWHAHSYASLCHCRLLGRRERGRLRTWRSNIQPKKSGNYKQCHCMKAYTEGKLIFKARTECKDRKIYFHNQLQFMFFPQTLHMKSKKARQVRHYQSRL